MYGKNQAKDAKLQKDWILVIHLSFSMIWFPKINNFFPYKWLISNI